MPVPTAISRTSSWPLAAPNLASAQAAALASFSTSTAQPRRSSTCFLTGSSRQARLGANSTVERVSSTKPAAPMPTESTGYRSRSSVTTSTMTCSVAAGLAAGVSRLTFSTIFPSGSTTPAATLVPPTSTPIARLIRCLRMVMVTRGIGVPRTGFRRPLVSGSRRGPGQYPVQRAECILDRGGNGVGDAGQARPARLPHPAGRPAYRAPGAFRRLAQVRRRLGGGHAPGVLGLGARGADGPADRVLDLAAHAPGAGPDDPPLEAVDQVGAGRRGLPPGARRGRPHRPRRRGGHLAVAGMGRLVGGVGAPPGPRQAVREGGRGSGRGGERP